jgi:hypothetical protein
MKTILTTSILAINLTFTASVMAQAPAKAQHAVPAPPPAQGTSQSGGAPAGVGVSGHGAAPHEVLFKKVDTDGNGTISSTEFRIAVTTGVIPQAGVGAGAQPTPDARAAAESAASGGTERKDTQKPAAQPAPR